MTVVFLAFTATKDWVAQQIYGQLTFGGASEAEVQRRLDQYAADRGLDRPLYEQYADWMGNMLTLDWGESFLTGEPVLPMVAEAVLRTAAYVLPALVIGIALGSLIGLYGALRPRSRLATGGRVAAYLLFALPGFWLGGLAVSAVEGEVIGRPALLFDHVLPVALATAALLGGYVSYSRAYALEQSSEPFVAFVRAKGGGPLSVLRHVVRNAAIPFLSMLFTEALGLLVLAVFVIEVLFAIDGFGLMLFFAIQERDIPVLLGGTLVVIGVGVLGNVLQDLSYRYLDPRVDGDRG